MIRIHPLRRMCPSQALAEEVRLAEELDSAPAAGAALFLWESKRLAAVMGRSGQASSEVRQAECHRLGVPVLRRTSGGGTALLGPGCLNYALVLYLERRPDLANVERSYEVILEGLARALGYSNVRMEGSDLTLTGRKFSGNAQRRLRRVLLHHGTILHGFDIRRMPQLLPEPPRQPGYRAGRSHLEFLTNLPLDLEAIQAALTRLAIELHQPPRRH